MTNKLSRLAEATSVTLLALTTLGILIYSVALMAVYGGEAILEFVGALPHGWSTTHLAAMAITGAVLAAPEIALGAWWLFRRALSRPDGGY